LTTLIIFVPCPTSFYQKYLSQEVKILNDSTEIMLEYLLIDVSFLDNIFIRKYDMPRSIG